MAYTKDNPTYIFFFFTGCYIHTESYQYSKYSWRTGKNFSSFFFNLTFKIILLYNTKDGYFC